MKKNIIFSQMLLSLFLTPFFVNAQLQEDQSVNIIPYWKKDDKLSLKLKTTSIDSSDEQKTISTSFFNIIINVIESTDKYTKIEWLYTDAKIADNEQLVENLVIGKLLKKKFIIQLSDVGEFNQLINYDEIRNEAEIIIDTRIKEYQADETISSQLRSYKQIIKTKPGFEAALMKHIKIYLFSFGDNYKQNQVKTNQLKIPNPLGGLPFDAVEKVSMTKIDKSQSFCVIETKKTVDAPALKTSVVNFLKKNNPGNDAAIENELKNVKLDLSEKTYHQINYEKGLPLKASFERITKFGFQNRTYILEIETAN